MKPQFLPELIRQLIGHDDFVAPAIERNTSLLRSDTREPPDGSSHAGTAVAFHGSRRCRPFPRPPQRRRRSPYSALARRLLFGCTGAVS